MTNNKNPNRQPNARSDAVVLNLRALTPLRPLTFWEHKTIAERQADLLHQLLHQSGPAADLRWLTELESMQVVLLPKWRMDGLSGITTRENDKWVIGVNMGNAPTRRRFTLAHEFKHALDANRDSLTYRNIDDRRRELIADYFAACYLMPKAWVRRSWTHGLQDPEALAGLFKVSRQAMDKRLHDLGFTDDRSDRTVASYFRTSPGVSMPSATTRPN